MLTTPPSFLERLRQPNQPEAWERFVRLYTPLLHLWARRQGFQEADVDNVIQDVLLKLIHKLPAYQRGEGQSFRGWLFRLTTRLCHDFRLRKATRSLPGADGLSEVSDRSTPPDQDETEDRRLLVRRGLDLVRPDFSAATWAAFHGVMVEGRSVPEVAAELKLSVNVVFLARHRVLTRLRQEVDGLLE